MSGYSILILTEADSKEDSIRSAEGEIDNLFERGELHGDDKGYVKGDADVLQLVEVGKSKLRELNSQRESLAQKLIKEALDEVKEKGFDSLALVRLPSENFSDPSYHSIGHNLWKAGAILEGYFCPFGIVYDSSEYRCGFSESRIKDLMAEPQKWWLVECIVG